MKGFSNVWISADGRQLLFDLYGHTWRLTLKNEKADYFYIPAGRGSGFISNQRSHVPTCQNAVGYFYESASKINISVDDGYEGRIRLNGFIEDIISRSNTTLSRALSASKATYIKSLVNVEII